MDALKLAHLLFLATWGGLVLAEIVVEALGTRDSQDFAPRAHFWMDVLIELPLIAGVLGTGAALSARLWPMTPLHWIKIAAGLVAISFNLYCGVLVWRRYQRRSDPAAVAALARRIRFTGIGIPAGLLAMVLGLGYFA